jgi:hypothetical protein
VNVHAFWGQFKDNKINGYGIISESNKTKFRGEFRNILREGNGQYMYNSSD